MSLRRGLPSGTRLRVLCADAATPHPLRGGYRPHRHTNRRHGVRAAAQTLLVSNRLGHSAMKDELIATHTVCALIDRLVTLYRLTARHRDLLIAAVVSTRHSDLAARLRKSRNTIKAQIALILERTGADSLEELVSPIRAAAMAHTQNTQQ